MYRDHPDNILGVNNNNNLFDSSSVAANPDGSMIERLQYLQEAIAAAGVAPGCFAWGEAAADTASTTTIVIAGLAGFGDDFFNNKYYLQVLHNADSAGNAPEAQVRKITDYVSATGTFTTDAFSANVGQDICLILHESLVAIGRDDNNNVFSSSNVAGNADGSVLERLEFLQALIGALTNSGGTATLAAIIGDVANSDLVTRLAAITTAIANLAAGGGFGTGIARKTVTFANATVDIPLFTVTGDVIVKLVAVCGTNVASAGGANIGVDAGAVALIADTDCTQLAAGEIWHDTSPDASAEAITVLKEFIIANGTDIVLDIQSEKQVDSGVINFYCFYTALSANGAVAAA